MSIVASGVQRPRGRRLADSRCAPRAAELLAATVLLAVDTVLIGYLTFVLADFALAGIRRFPAYAWLTAINVLLAVAYPVLVVMTVRSAVEGWRGRIDTHRLLATALWCLLPALGGALIGLGLWFALVLFGAMGIF